MDHHNLLKPYRVTLHEEPGDKFQLVFECLAEDADHAAEQTENAYPGCTVIHTGLLSDEDELAKSDAIRAEYLASGCQASDVDHAVHRLMTECGPLFDNDRAAWSFLMEELHEDLEEESDQSITGLPPDSWLRTLSVGSEVWWEDPDEGFSSGFYRVDSILSERGVEHEDTVLMLKNAAGSFCEVFAHELFPTNPRTA